MEREPGPRPHVPVGAVEHLADQKPSERCAAIPFALQRADTGAAERGLTHAMGERDSGMVRFPRRPPDDDRPGSLNPHGGPAFFTLPHLAMLVQAPPPAYNSTSCGIKPGAADEQCAQDPHHRR